MTATYFPESPISGMIEATVTLWAGSADEAQAGAKETARADGYRVRGVRSVREVAPDGDRRMWTVTLGVRPVRP